MLWTLLLSGWRHFNRSTKFSGHGAGARLRRWWWGVNNWKLPETKSRLRDTKLAKNVSEVSFAFLKVCHHGVLIVFRHTDRGAVLRRRVLERGSGLSAVAIALHFSALQVQILMSSNVLIMGNTNGRTLIQPSSTNPFLRPQVQPTASLPQYNYAKHPARPFIYATSISYCPPP